MPYNVEPLRTKNEIEDVKFWLRRGINGKRNEFLFLLGINTGLRASDILALKVGDVKHNDEPIITDKKTSKKRRLCLLPLHDLIQEYCANMSDDEYLFPSRTSRKGSNKPLRVNGLYQIFRDVGKKLNRNDLGTHTMRKTFGYAYYQKTHDIAKLMEIFNHSSEKITLRYIGVNEDQIKDSLKGFQVGL